MIHKFYDEEKDGFLNMKEVDKLLQIKTWKKDFDFELGEEKWKKLCEKIGCAQSDIKKGWNVCHLQTFYIDEKINVFEIVQKIK